MVRKKNKLVRGVGANDADYPVYSTVSGKRVICTFYATWNGMLQRCYDANYQAVQPTYIGCTVCDEWLKFSNFKAWMETQSWQGKALDKDLLVRGNKIYSPDTCVFVDSATNNFTAGRAAARGEWPIGVHFFKRAGKFMAMCSNPFTRKREHLGYFNCPEQAHQAWSKRKHELALQVADIQTDERVANALRLRYALELKT